MKYAIKYRGGKGNYSNLTYETLDEVSDVFAMMRLRAEREGKTFVAPTVHEVHIDPEPIAMEETA